MMDKFWKSFVAQVNKLANYFWQRDPIAQMQLEYDSAVSQLKDGRTGLEQYRALVERVTRQVAANERECERLTAQVKALLKAGDRDNAGKYAIELKRAQQEQEENRSQLKLHETSYENNVRKIKFASDRLAQVRQKIQKYDAELKMSEAEAEVARLAQSFNFDITTDFGELESILQEKIDLNHAKVRVAADLSGQGIAEIEAEEKVQKVMADDLLSQFEVEMGLKTADTAKVAAQEKVLGDKAAQRDATLRQVEKELGEK